MTKKQSIISILIGFVIYKVITYFVNKVRFRKNMEDVKNQVFNNPFYKKQREEMGL